MSEYQNRPKIKFAEVREYQSANGKPYFSFYLGKVKALMYRAEPVGNHVAAKAPMSPAPSSPCLVGSGLSLARMGSATLKTFSSSAYSRPLPSPFGCSTFTRSGCSRQ